MSKLIPEPIRPYCLLLFIVLAGVLMETAAAVAQARPLKTVLDNVVGSHHLPKWLTGFVGPLPGGTSKVLVAVFAALMLVAIAGAAAIAGRLRASRRGAPVIRINGGVAAQERTYAELNEAQYETQPALAA
jgi:hypothetical protein